MIALTGASGQLGHLVIEELVNEGIPLNEIMAVARSTDKLANLQEKGLNVRYADYEKPETIKKALNGATRLLLISASEVGKRFKQHKNVIDMAKESTVEFIAYTSILKADSSPLSLAKEHRETEDYLKSASIPYTFLRNGWYSENYTQFIGAALEFGHVSGCAGDAKFSCAERRDYALAAAKVLASKNHAGKTYELAGDTAFKLSDFAKMISEQAGRNISYENISQDEFAALMQKAGLPPLLAKALADAEIGASKGALFDDSKQLSSLIGRPTTPILESIKKVLPK